MVHKLVFRNLRSRSWYCITVLTKKSCCWGPLGTMQAQSTASTFPQALVTPKLRTTSEDSGGATGQYRRVGLGHKELWFKTQSFCFILCLSGICPYFL